MLNYTGSDNNHYVQPSLILRPTPLTREKAGRPRLFGYKFGATDRSARAIPPKRT